MKIYRLIDNDELVALPEDLKTLIRTADSLATPSASNVGESYFLRTSCKVGTRVYLKGYVYKCVSHYETDPETGIKTLVYSWELATFSEAGALDKVSDAIITVDTTEGYAALSWTDPEDKKYRDVADNASWSCTIVVRKFIPRTARDTPQESNYVPKSINDGEVVAVSGVRHQYNNPAAPLYDRFPAGSKYAYNIFAVTKYGVATGLDAEDSKELTWDDVRDIIRAGNAGSIFSVGDCVTIEHGLLGTVDLQVVHMGNNIPVIRDIDSNVVETYGVIFMSRYCLPKCTYDAKERSRSLPSIYGLTVPNPADNISDAYAEYKASNRGRADWIDSNLRHLLNDSTSFYVSQDTKWNLNKYYFIYEHGDYTQVPIPVWPDRVNPKELGYYEARYDFVSQHQWDLPPSELEQPCVYGGRELPGFYDFIEADFRHVIATAAVDTFGSNLTNEPDPTHLYPTVRTLDKIFIPSYYELFGRNSDVRFGVDRSEGLFWSYFNPNVEIPDLGETRSHLKYSVEGVLSGYYTRSLGLIETSPNVFSIRGDSSVWSIKSKGFTEPPPLGTSVAVAAPCSLSKVSAAKNAPGVAWCCIVA